MSTGGGKKDQTEKEGEKRVKESVHTEEKGRRSMMELTVPLRLFELARDVILVKLGEVLKLLPKLLFQRLIILLADSLLTLLHCPFYNVANLMAS